MEMLIVIGLLGALASLVLSGLSAERTDLIDHSLVQKELADIQAAFQRFEADCLPTQDDYKKISQYGLEILMDYKADPVRGWSFADKWDWTRNKGWRGPYLAKEGSRAVDVSVEAANDDICLTGQEPGGTRIEVIETPYQADADGDAGEPDFYRVVPSWEEVDGTKRIIQLWVVFPPRTNQTPSLGDLLDDAEDGISDEDEILNGYTYARRLMLH